MVKSQCSVPAFKSYTKTQVIALLHSNPMAVEHAIKALYARQTPDEQITFATTHLNGMGFNAADARRLSWVAENVLNAGKHLRTETASKYAARLSKYAGQLASLAMLNMNRALIAELSAEVREATAQAAEGGDIARVAHAEDAYNAVLKAIRNPS